MDPETWEDVAQSAVKNSQMCVATLTATMLEDLLCDQTEEHNTLEVEVGTIESTTEFKDVGFNI